jgi:hypothetical protein
MMWQMSRCVQGILGASSTINIREGIAEKDGDSDRDQDGDDRVSRDGGAMIVESLSDWVRRA